MKKLHYILIALFLVSCTSNTILEKPKDLIPKDTMVNLLTDLYLASSASTVKNKNLELNTKYMPIVYNKYKIDSLRFKTSNIYYLSKIDEYGKLFNKVKDSLNTLLKIYKAEDDSKQKINKNKLYRKKDSLKKTLKTIKLKSLDYLRKKKKKEILKTY